ncbi:hypothetical protein TwortDSMZ_124 [Staphylococcus phage Twort]|uniref:Uncharacterized protein n=2 Tax=Staphylococcus phage Twort (strain DSM 17442 / HER 48) TaxID=2908167 RepID=A0A6H0X5E3_BPTWO|nr:ORF232 [Staphylococcus phage Twort]AAX92472.1 ORF232 [Staphylococcus phage Twort]QIW89123.1 hypothetical protein TwortDSMZ_124 [Staphylococcus phage Twort]
MPNEYRDPYSQTKIFIPTPQEKSVLEMHDRLNKKEKLLDEKLKQIDELISRGGLK